MEATVPPRIYCLPATEAPVVAVFRRGPSSWTHVGRWDLRERRYEPGAWLRGMIYPRRCDLTPDGRFLCYFALKATATWKHGDSYMAVSKLPWLTALYALAAYGTWTRGYCFTEKKEGEDLIRANLPIPYGLRMAPEVQFATERRLGWVESEDSPPRDPRDMWDERRHARLHKRQPGGDHLLCVERREWVGGYGVDQAFEMPVGYWLEKDGDIELLDQLQWADWDRDGNLLVATRSGKLEIWKLGGDRTEILFEEDLSPLEPNPVPAPDWARQW